MRLYLVRHARPDGFSGDTPLGAEGIKEAEKLAALFARLSLGIATVKLLSSEAQRARQTADRIVQGIGLPDEQQAPFPAPIDGMPGVNLQERLMKRVARIAREENRSEFIVVGHFDYLEESFKWLLGLEAQRYPGSYGATAAIRCDAGFDKGAGQLEWLVLPKLMP